MHILDKIKTSRTYFDGGTGTWLQQRGLRPGELPERWNLTHPEEILALHRAYFEAGADIVTTNTFGANPLKYDDLEDVLEAGIRLAQEARKQAGREADGYVAFDIGPLGRMLQPLGDLPFEEAVALFARGVQVAQRCGADVILIETMNDAYETKAAVLAAKENSTLPVFVTNVYDESGKLMTGADPAAMVALLEGLRVDALGMNCSLGPKQMLGVLPELVRHAHVPVIVSPNAGLPRSENGQTVYDVDEADFAETMAKIARGGACVLGGCCGTTPDYIRLMVEKTKDIPLVLPSPAEETLISSYTHAVDLARGPVLIGERINPTGKKKFKQALRDHNIGYLLDEGIRQEEKGAHVLDVNVGLPEIDEPALMADAVTELQAVISLPLQIDTVDPVAMERALRLYNGKAMVNSVNGKEHVMREVFPLVKKYGGVVVALTIDEDGIPATAEGRVAVAEKILTRAAEYGIPKRDIVVDPLAMTISSDTESANVTLEAIHLLKEKLGVCTSLGVSNISFGLPRREIINAAFFAMALQTGLDCAIMNPDSQDMMQVYYSFNALRGRDANCARYIEYASALPAKTTAAATGAKVLSAASSEEKGGSPLQQAIVKGLHDQAHALAKELLKTCQPLEVINGEIVPALDIVGRGFERKTVFLPQLLMAAEAAKAAFEAVKAVLPAGSGGEKIVLATVQGDIHDIGKNIVRVLLENYGFQVIDLGRDVPPQTVCDAVLRENVRLVGLSALMTTTVPAMAETIRMLRECAPDTKVVVGGAVLTREYAEQIGADCYAKDAMETVRYAEQFFGR